MFDGWSEGVFLRELAALYLASDLHASPQLPELPIQYADFAEWQRQQTTDVAVAAGLGYWTNQLADAPSSLNLPLDRARPLEPTRRGGIVRDEPVQRVGSRSRGLQQTARSNAIHDASCRLQRHAPPVFR